MKQQSKELQPREFTLQNRSSSPSQVAKLVWVGQHPRAPLLVYVQPTKIKGDEV